MSVSVAGGDGGRPVVVTISGEVDLTVAPLLERALGEVVGRGGEVVVDVADVDFIDVRGCRDLLAFRQALDGAGRAVTVLAGPATERIIDVLDVREQLIIGP